METKEAIEEIQGLMADFIDQDVFVTIGYDTVVVKAFGRSFRLTKMDNLHDILLMVGMLQERELS